MTVTDDIVRCEIEIKWSSFDEKGGGDEGRREEGRRREDGRKEEEGTFQQNVVLAAGSVQFKQTAGGAMGGDVF